MKLNRYNLYIVVYILVAFGTALFSQSGEVRPIFNGHWFIYAPSKFSDYGLLIQEIDGKKLESPVYFDRSGKKLGRIWSFDNYNLAQSIGKKFEEGNQQKLDEIIEVLKARLNRNQTIQVTLQKRVFNPEKYIKDGTVDSTEDLKSFYLEIK